MVSQLDTAFSVLRCNNLLDFLEKLSLRCSITTLYQFSFPFLISNLIFFDRDNHFHNILMISYALSNFPFTVSETMCDYYL